MLIPLLVTLPIISSIGCLGTEKINKKFPKVIAATTVITTYIILNIIKFKSSIETVKYYVHETKNTNQIAEYIRTWIPTLGININLQMDNLSYVMISLAIFLGAVSIGVAWNNEVEHRVGLYYFYLMWLLASNIGCLLAVDIFLFFCFWEVLSLPIYFVINIWGLNLKNQVGCSSAALHFFLVSQLSGLLMLVSCVGLALNFYFLSHIFCFDRSVLLCVPMSYVVEYSLMFCFFVSLVLKMPVVPFHSWLVDAHVCSPANSSIDLSGFLLKTSVYGFLRFCLPIFPNVSSSFSMIAIILGFFTLFYSIFVAFSENNLKRIVAYNSIAHMGILLIVIYSFTIADMNYLSLIVFQIISNCISITGLFVLLGQLYRRFLTYDLREITGLYDDDNWFSGFLLFFVLANIAIPGTSNFVGEFLILLELFKKNYILAILLSTSLIFFTICLIRVIQHVNYGVCTVRNKLFKISLPEFFINIILVILIFILGIHPLLILDIF